MFRLPPEEAERLRLAYACSVHRGQGIELPVAVIVAHPAAGAFFLRREMLYTAVTRARLATVIVGTRETVARAARTADTGRRHSRLAERLEEVDMSPPETVSVETEDGATRAEFVPERGHAVRSLTDDGSELLDQGRGVEAYRERGKTMGIPLLYPWANRLADFGFEAAGRRVALPARPGTEIPPTSMACRSTASCRGLMRWQARAQRGRRASAELELERARCHAPVPVRAPRAARSHAESRPSSR